MATNRLGQHEVRVERQIPPRSAVRRRWLRGRCLQYASVRVPPRRIRWEDMKRRLRSWPLLLRWDVPPPPRWCRRSVLARAARSTLVRAVKAAAGAGFAAGVVVPLLRAAPASFDSGSAGSEYAGSSGTLLAVPLAQTQNRCQRRSGDDAYASHRPHPDRRPD